MPGARIEYPDGGGIRTVNAHSNLDDSEADVLFAEFHGSEGSVAEQVTLFGEMAEANGSVKVDAE